VVGVDELTGHHRVGRVGGHRGEAVAELRAHLLERGPVAGNADDARTGPGERAGDAAAEPAAGPRDERR